MTRTYHTEAEVYDETGQVVGRIAYPVYDARLIRFRDTPGVGGPPFDPETGAPRGHSLRLPHTPGHAPRDCQECHDALMEDRHNA